MNVFTTQLVKTFQDSLQEWKKKTLKLTCFKVNPSPSFFILVATYLCVQIIDSFNSTKQIQCQSLCSVLGLL